MVVQLAEVFSLFDGFPYQCVLCDLFSLGYQLVPSVVPGHYNAWALFAGEHLVGPVTAALGKHLSGSGFVLVGVMWQVLAALYSFSMCCFDISL